MSKQIVLKNGVPYVVAANGRPRRLAA